MIYEDIAGQGIRGIRTAQVSIHTLLLFRENMLYFFLQEMFRVDTIRRYTVSRSRVIRVRLSTLSFPSRLFFDEIQYFSRSRCDVFVTRCPLDQDLCPRVFRQMSSRWLSLLAFIPSDSIIGPLANRVATLRSLAASALFVVRARASGVVRCFALDRASSGHSSWSAL